MESGTEDELEGTVAMGSSRYRDSGLRMEEAIKIIGYQITIIAHLGRRKDKRERRRRDEVLFPPLITM